MVVQLITVVFGALALVVAFAAWREGRLPIIDVRRGERRFGVAVGALAAVGIGCAAVGFAMAGGRSAPRELSGDHHALVVPSDWVRRTDVEERLDLGGRVYGDDEHELWVLASSASDGSGATVRERLGRLESLVAPPNAETRVREGERRLTITAQYDTPRGPTQLRAVGAVDEAGETRWVTATCTHRGAPDRCRRALSSLHLTVRGLPLTARP